MNLNLGGGGINFPGFQSVDHRASVKPDILGDAFMLPMISSNSVDKIIASHLLEHACFDRTIAILQRWNEVLKSRGELWVAVPNFELVITEHLKKWQAAEIPWEYFCSRIFGNAEAAHRMYGKGQVGDVPGVYKYELAFHRAVFTPAMLESCLKRAGFVNIFRVKVIPNKRSHPHELCMTGQKA